MIKPELTATPRLAPGIRLDETKRQPRMQLMGGREVRLSGPSLEIVLLCDGKHTVQQIAEKLHTLYAKAEPHHAGSSELSGALARPAGR